MATGTRFSSFWTNNLLSWVLCHCLLKVRNSVVRMVVSSKVHTPCWAKYYVQILVPTSWSKLISGNQAKCLETHPDTASCPTLVTLPPSLSTLSVAMVPYHAIAAGPTTRVKHVSGVFTAVLNGPLWRGWLHSLILGVTSPSAELRAIHGIEGGGPSNEGWQWRTEVAKEASF